MQKYYVNYEINLKNNVKKSQSIFLILPIPKNTPSQKITRLKLPISAIIKKGEAYANRYSKKQGFSFYNLWGIALEDKPHHPWRGLTFFKKGFGGFAKEYLPTQDYVLKPTYWFNWITEILRRIKKQY